MNIKVQYSTMIVKDLDESEEKARNLGHRDVACVLKGVPVVME